MNMLEWVYWRLPEQVREAMGDRVREAMDNREITRMADAQYEQYWASIQEGKWKERDLYDPATKYVGLGYEETEEFLRQHDDMGRER